MTYVGRGCSWAGRDFRALTRNINVPLSARDIGVPMLARDSGVAMVAGDICIHTFARDDDIAHFCTGTE